MEFGYLLRSARSGDDEVWCQVTDGHTYDGWNPDKFRSEVLHAPQFDPHGLFFVTMGSRAAGTACAWIPRPGERDIGVLRLLVVKEEHRRKGIGGFLALQVLRYFKNRGFRACQAEIKDHGLAGIKTFLSLGFTPVCANDNQRRRWNHILRRINHQ